jgi:hypothetical protein
VEGSDVDKGREGQNEGSEETNRIEETSVMNTDPLKVHFLRAESMGEDSKH